MPSIIYQLCCCCSFGDDENVRLVAAIGEVVGVVAMCALVLFVCLLFAPCRIGVCVSIDVMFLHISMYRSVFVATPYLYKVACRYTIVYMYTVAYRISHVGMPVCYLVMSLRPARNDDISHPSLPSPSSFLSSVLPSLYLHHPLTSLLSILFTSSRSSPPMLPPHPSRPPFQPSFPT